MNDEEKASLYFGLIVVAVIIVIISLVICLCYIEPIQHGLMTFFNWCCPCCKKKPHIESRSPAEIADGPSISFISNAPVTPIKQLKGEISTKKEFFESPLNNPCVQSVNVSGKDPQGKKGMGKDLKEKYSDSPQHITNSNDGKHRRKKFIARKSVTRPSIIDVNNNGEILGMINQKGEIPIRTELFPTQNKTGQSDHIRRQSFGFNAVSLRGNIFPIFQDAKINFEGGRRASKLGVFEGLGSTEGGDESTKRVKGRGKLPSLLPISSQVNTRTPTPQEGDENKISEEQSES